jgi:hypothetical protein
MVRGCLSTNIDIYYAGLQIPRFHHPPPPPKLLLRLTTDPQPLQMRVLQRMRASFSSFHSQDLIVSLRSSSSCLRLIPRLFTPLYFLQEHISEDSFTLDSLVSRYLKLNRCLYTSPI